MSKISRNLYRKKLQSLLGRADDNAFLVLAWSISALQSDQVDAASRHMRFRQNAIGAELGSRDHVPLWMLETLINEFLRAPKERRIPGRSYKVLDCTHMDQMLAALQLLLKLENAEDEISLGRMSIFDEMRRINQRQFEWQGEILSPARIYRSRMIYEGGAVDQFFRERNGIGINDLSLAGFALFSILQSELSIQGMQCLPEIGLTAEIYQRALDIISQPIAQAKEQARKSARFGQNTAYLPSVLRRFPIIKVDDVRDISVAPLPPLILRRVTSGISIDLYGAPESVTSEVSERFESYSSELVAKILPNHTVSREFAYGNRKFTKRSPDILVSRGNKINIVIECKSTGMTYSAKFAQDLAAAEKYKIADIGKGIFQIWRFFSHMRQGLVKDWEYAENVFGVLLTLDDWFTMSRNLVSEMFENAHKRCVESSEEILVCDKKPIVLAWIEDFEYLQRVCQEDQFLQVMQAAQSKEYRGWFLPGLVDEVLTNERAQNPFAFADEFQNQPWWKKLIQ